jgi:phosphoesterase RecJ-like protein
VINMTLAIAGTQFAVIVVEQAGGGCKISFRSRCRADCSQLAEQFGGGGHKAAAGAFIDAPADEALARVLDVIRPAVQ